MGPFIQNEDGIYVPLEDYERLLDLAKRHLKSSARLEAAMLLFIIMLIIIVWFA
ncbi:MAG: hypothetical protein [Siphoviridae sp. ctvD11]|nr:MAG: hypothetical protein [Siphoviridae sp. ctvD11]